MGLFSKIFDDILGFNPPKAPPAPPPPPPPVEKVSAEATDEIKRRQRARLRGRAKTIVTGDLTPEKPEKVNLLGRTV